MGTFLCRVEVCPGSALDLAFPGSPVDVQVGCGEPEAISLCTKDLGGDSCVQHVVLDLGRTRLSVAPAGSGALHGSVAASIPAKYTSVSIITRGKATLEGVSEAALSVQTQGGDMSLGKVKASSLTARSGGGRIFGSLVGHTVRIESEGGNVTLGNLSGEDVSVATRGGSVQAAAAYAAQLSVSSVGAAAEPAAPGMEGVPAEALAGIQRLLADMGTSFQGRTDNPTVQSLLRQVLAQLQGPQPPPTE
ncbi:hypothetical protein F751_4300 [Auxenochlorella protothecoides]|uniref:Adhesin domain-containing protein n=1 Tax=Auxenochlorella protothecoides TaxID=3075 RepID=A0A087SSX1_AUXPR|nr:hypothetical protein F751_4300 [Auxenochlorella protothecoides]KFM28825.1 hypothetical protein F751_4300 [Auxenochlorella protothecoides]